MYQIGIEGGEALTILTRQELLVKEKQQSEEKT